MLFTRSDGRRSMIIIDEERASDSPFVERVWRSHSEGVNPFLSIAVNHCELVVSRGSSWFLVKRWEKLSLLLSSRPLTLGVV
jgi:hypothetical protein